MSATPAAPATPGQLVDEDVARLHALGYAQVLRRGRHYADAHPAPDEVVLLFAGGWWVISARKWYKGPISQGGEAELRALEESMATSERVLEGAR